MDIKNYHDLKIWKDTTALILSCYHVTRNFPENEMHRLAHQIKRVVLSASLHIIEVIGNSSVEVLVKRLSLAHELLADLETHLQDAERLDYIDKFQLSKLIDRSKEIEQMINDLHQKQAIKHDHSKEINWKLGGKNVS